MMQRTTLFVVTGSFIALLCACQGGVAKKNRMARVGHTIISQQDIDAFNTASRYMPMQTEEFLLASRPTVSALVETEILYKKARWDLRNIKDRRSADWQWKKRYFIATMFTQNVLQQNLGFSENQLRQYYAAHKSEFMGAMKYDSVGGKRCSTQVVRPFDEVKWQIVEKMFIRDHKPDSSFKKMTGVTDTAELKTRWVQYMRERGFRDYFMKIYYKEKYGKPYPDSLRDLYGNGKAVDSSDMKVILSWIPEYRRADAKNNPQALMDFAGWLMKWKLFSEKAVETGYASKPEVQNAITWAWRLQIAQRYVTEKLVPLAKKGITLDTAMARYSYWDDNGNPGTPIDSAQLRTHLEKLTSTEVAANFEKLLYDMRRGQKVKFFNNDWRDEKVKDPAKLMHEADSLRDTGNSAEAESRYRTLTTDFIFTPQGRKALVELAKIQTEQQNYNEAIKNYRHFLYIDADPGKQCNTMFMIGFIYDEYLDRPDMAEVNYKWVLKNAPDCELADDAEFMMLHLGEQMSSVEELQAEVKRQGKKVEAADTTAAGLTVDSVAETAKKQKT